ncbi:MAG: GNAT family N-acetyltransferase [Ginsengibacter sp.]
MNYFSPKNTAERYAKGRPFFHRNTIKHISEFIKIDNKLENALDVACGTGLSTTILDGEEHLFYAQLNKTDTIRHVIVAYDNDEYLGCGAIREYSKDVMEVKKMYVLPSNRGKGIASIVLKQLEDWSKELNCKELVLETGKKQPEAICLPSRLSDNYDSMKG